MSSSLPRAVRRKNLLWLIALLVLVALMYSVAFFHIVHLPSGA